MDDYSGGDGVKIKNTMNQFLDRHMGEYTIIHSGYQLALRKPLDAYNCGEPCG